MPVLVFLSLHPLPTRYSIHRQEHQPLLAPPLEYHFVSAASKAKSAVSLKYGEHQIQLYLVC